MIARKAALQNKTQRPFKIPKDPIHTCWTPGGMYLLSSTNERNIGQVAVAQTHE